jgi:hypothetical protein
LAGETEVLGENLPQRHFCPSQNPTCLGPVSNPGPQRWEVVYLVSSLYIGVDWSRVKFLGGVGGCSRVSL